MIRPGQGQRFAAVLVSYLRRNGDCSNERHPSLLVPTMSPQIPAVVAVATMDGNEQLRSKDGDISINMSTMLETGSNQWIKIIQYRTRHCTVCARTHRTRICTVNISTERKAFSQA